MQARPTLPATLLISVLLCLAAPAPAQSVPEWWVGSGFLVYRPYDSRLWGLNVRREQPITRLVVFRGVASVDFLGPGFRSIPLDPLLVTVGADVGLRARLAPISALVALGPTVAHFVAQRHLYTICQGGSCFEIQRGYEPGFLLAATGSAALGLQVSSELRVFTEARMHVPSRIGRSGYAGDPHAAFVEVAFGVSLQR